jgi:hypothetical protein
MDAHVLQRARISSLALLVSTHITHITSLLTCCSPRAHRLALLMLLMFLVYCLYYYSANVLQPAHISPHMRVRVSLAGWSGQDSLPLQ